MTADGATVIWGTSADALSWVEAAPDGEDHFYAEERPQYYQTKLGKRTVGRLHTVRITGLKPASFYRYRVCSREVTELQPYKVSYGQTICSDVYRKKPYRFKTRDAAQQSVSFTVVNDIHENSDMLATLLSDVKKSSATSSFQRRHGQQHEQRTTTDRRLSAPFDRTVRRRNPFLFTRQPRNAACSRIITSTTSPPRPANRITHSARGPYFRRDGRRRRQARQRHRILPGCPTSTATAPIRWPG